MLHCHILSHEEMDMMRPVVVATAPVAPTWPLPTDTPPPYLISGKTLTLTYNDNSLDETQFLIQRNAGFGWVDLGIDPSPLDMPNTNTMGVTRVITSYSIHYTKLYEFLFPFTSFLASFDKGSRHDMTHSQYCSYGFMVITGVHDILIWIIQRNGSGKRLGESYNFEKPDDALLPYRRHPLCHNDCVLLGETFS